MNLKKGRNKEGKLIQLKNHPHPGVFLVKEIIKRGISQAEAARLMGMFPHHFNEISNGKRGITIPIALRLEKTFGLDPEYWMILQLKYDLYCCRYDPRMKKKLEKAEVYSAFK